MWKSWSCCDPLPWLSICIFGTVKEDEQEKERVPKQKVSLSSQVVNMNEVPWNLSLAFWLSWLIYYLVFGFFVYLIFLVEGSKLGNPDKERAIEGHYWNGVPHHTLCITVEGTSMVYSGVVWSCAFQIYPFRTADSLQGCTFTGCSIIWGQGVSVRALCVHSALLNLLEKNKTKLLWSDHMCFVLRVGINIFGLWVKVSLLKMLFDIAFWREDVMLLMSLWLEFRDYKVVVLVLVRFASSLGSEAALASLRELFCWGVVEGILPAPFHISFFLILGLDALLVPWSCLL